MPHECDDVVAKKPATELLVGELALRSLQELHGAGIRPVRCTSVLEAVQTAPRFRFGACEGPGEDELVEVETVAHAGVNVPCL